MNGRMIKLAAGGGIAAALALGGAAWATAGGGDGQVTGPGADRASAAALAELGGGKVNAVERDNEQGATWEVEVTKQSGEMVDVRLDANYRVVGVDGDAETGDDKGGAEDEGAND